MAQKTIPELQEITSPPIATTFLAADDGTQTFKLSLGELLRRPKNYRPTMTITPSVAAAITTFEHIIKLEVLMDEGGLEWWVADINVQFALATATQTGFTIAFAGLLFESFCEQPGVLAVTPSGGSPAIYTAGTSLYCTPNTNVLVAKHPSGSTVRYGVQGRFMLKEKPSFAADTEFLVLDGAGNPTAGGGLTNVAVNTTGTITANTFEECDSSVGSITRTLPPLPLGGVGQKGITVVLLDAARAASDTLDIVLAPATGERLNVPGLVANDTLAINVPGGWIGAYAAPGDTSWKIQTQSSTIGGLPGQTPGYTGTTPIAAGNIGESVGTVRSGTGGESKSIRSNVVLTIANQVLLTTTLKKGLYLFGYVVNSSWSLDGYVESTTAKVGGTTVIYGTNNPSKANLQVTSSAGPIPLLITTDDAVLTVEGSWSGGIGSSTANYHEMWITRIA